MWKFSKYCNGTNVYKRSGNSFQCKAFHELLQRSGLEIAKAINKYAMGFMRVKNVMNQCELNLLNFQTLINFTCSNNTHLSASGLYLKKIDRVQIQYYNSIKSTQESNKACVEKKIVPIFDEHLSFFIYLYKSN